MEIKELYLGCECLGLDHVAQLTHASLSDENEEKKDDNLIYLAVNASNDFNRIIPMISSFFSKYWWMIFFNSSWYKRILISFRYICNSHYHPKGGVLNGFDFQNKDLNNLDSFLSLVSKDTNYDIGEESKIWLSDDKWNMEIFFNELPGDEMGLTTLWQIGWEIHFKSRYIFGRIIYSLKYLFGYHSKHKSFSIYEQEACKLRGMIKWAQENN